MSLPPPLPTQAALFLDFDGTLVELADRPEEVRVRPQLRSLLRALAVRQCGALAIVSGRRLADVDAVLAPLLLPGAGLHGAELRPRVDAEATIRHCGEMAEVAAGLSARFNADPRLRVENKGGAVALHFRGAPERAADCIAAMRELVAGRAIEMIGGKQVVEARPLGIDKGFALRAIAAEAPFRGRMPVFVGDDVTDEDGFAAAAASGGYAIKVGTGPTRAHYRCRDVQQVYAWLRASLRGASGAENGHGRQPIPGSGSHR
ncbi:MAG: trehalose-phosphatase [Nevskia sp.]|nr:trehalose-phosphatase [Nevskia sp.]